MAPQHLYAVFRTRGMKPAFRPYQREEPRGPNSPHPVLVDLQKRDECVSHVFEKILLFSNSSDKSAWISKTSLLKPLTTPITISNPVVFLFKNGRTASLRVRLMRLRSTAFFITLPGTRKPKRSAPCAFEDTLRKKKLPLTAFPSRSTR